MDTNLGSTMFPNDHPKEGEGVIQSNVESDMFTKNFILKFCAISIVSAGKYGNLTPYLSFINVEK